MVSGSLPIAEAPEEGRSAPAFAPILDFDALEPGKVFDVHGDQDQVIRERNRGKLTVHVRSRIGKFERASAMEYCRDMSSTYITMYILHRPKPPTTDRPTGTSCCCRKRPSPPPPPARGVHDGIAVIGRDQLIELPEVARAIDPRNPPSAALTRVMVALGFLSRLLKAWTAYSIISKGRALARIDPPNSLEGSGATRPSQSGFGWWWSCRSRWVPHPNGFHSAQWTRVTPGSPS